MGERTRAERVASLNEALDEIDDLIVVKIGEVDDGPVVQGARIGEQLPDKVPLTASGYLQATLSICERVMLAKPTSEGPS